MMDGYGKLKRKEDSFRRLYIKLFSPFAAIAIFILSGAAIISFSNFTGIHYFGIILLLNIFIGFLFDIFVSTAIVYLRFKKEEVND
jgi:predicted RND superfamily exporter protein